MPGVEEGPETKEQCQTDGGLAQSAFVSRQVSYQACRHLGGSVPRPFTSTGGFYTEQGNLLPGRSMREGRSRKGDRLRTIKYAHEGEWNSSKQ